MYKHLCLLVSFYRKLIESCRWYTSSPFYKYPTNFLPEIRFVDSFPIPLSTGSPRASLRLSTDATRASGDGLRTSGGSLRHSTGKAPTPTGSLRASQNISQSGSVRNSLDTSIRQTEEKRDSLRRSINDTTSLLDTHVQGLASLTAERHRAITPEAEIEYYKRQESEYTGLRYVTDYMSSVEPRIKRIRVMDFNQQ